MGSFLVGATGTGNSYAAQSAPIDKQKFQPLLDNTMNQYNGAQGALDQIISGQTLTPGQVQLQQATENAIKMGAGSVAGMKGISPALQQRMIAENTANQTQKAAGQGALIGAQEHMGAINEKMGGANSMYSTLQNGQAAQNNAIVGNTSNMNNVNAGVASQNAATAGGLMGGLMSGGAAAMGFDEGGTVPKVANYDGGGQVSSWGYNDQPPVDNNASMAMTAKYIDSGGKAMGAALSGKPQKQAPTTTGTAQPWEQGGGMAGGPMDVMGKAPMGAGMMAAAKGGSVPAHFQHVAHIYHGGMLSAQGGGVNGQAPVNGAVDTKKNDIVPAMLSPGEVVLPRSVTQSANPVEAAKNFMAEELRKNGGNEHGDFHEALKRAIVSRGKK